MVAMFARVVFFILMLRLTSCESVCFDTGGIKCFEITSPHRSRQIIGIGAARTGSTQLAQLIRLAYPRGNVASVSQTLGPQACCGSETSFFSSRFSKGLDFYDSLYAKDKLVDDLLFEKTPNYSGNPVAPYRAAILLGSTRGVSAVYTYRKDPFRALQSIFHHHYGIHAHTDMLSFVNAAVSEHSQYLQCRSRLLVDYFILMPSADQDLEEAMLTLSLREALYVEEGIDRKCKCGKSGKYVLDLFARGLKRWVHALGASNVRCLELGEVIADPESSYLNLLTWIDGLKRRKNSSVGDGENTDERKQIVELFAASGHINTNTHNARIYLNDTTLANFYDIFRSQGQQIKNLCAKLSLVPDGK